MSNHYDTLGIAETASIEEVHQAYLKLARANNPVRLTGHARSEAEVRLRAINAAWDELKNPEKRRAYDATLSPPIKTRASRSEPALSTRSKPTASKPPPPRTWGPLVGLVVFIVGCWGTLWMGFKVLGLVEIENETLGVLLFFILLIGSAFGGGFATIIFEKITGRDIDFT